MCFNAPVSLGAFSIGTLFSLILVARGTPDMKILGYFFAFVALMQLIEYALWMHQVCDGYNRGLSYAGMILNHAQPVVLAGLIFLFSKESFSRPFLLAALALYSACIVPYSMEYAKATTEQCTMQQPGSPHLIWNWNMLPKNQYIYIFAFLPMILLSAWIGLRPPMNMILAFVALFTYLVSFILYREKGAVGALWCFFSAFVPAFLWLFTK